MNEYAVAVDIGSSGGKLLAATLAHGKLQIHNEFVFNNRPVEIMGSIYLNLIGIYGNVIEGLKRFSGLDGRVASIGFDSSTSMYAYLDQYGRPKYNIQSGRDPRLNTILEEQKKIFDPWDQYRLTGIPPFPRNILSEVYRDILEDKPLVERMSSVLALPDLLIYFLTGLKQSEQSYFSISGLTVPGGRGWNREIIKKFSIPEHLLQPLKAEGVAGPVTKQAALLTGCPGALVTNVAEHDTASAAAAVPGFTEDDVFLSLGSTNLLGVQRDDPIITEEGHRQHFKNAAMICGKYMYMRDITGFWILDECIKFWKSQGMDANFDKLVALSMAAEENRSYIDVDALVFSSYSVDMPGEIRHYCKITGQKVPETTGEIVRCVFESCALSIRHCYENLCRISGRNYSGLYAVSGGIRVEPFCQAVADALQKPLSAGNPMASSTGNLLTQLLVTGSIKSLDEMRHIARNTFPQRVYTPDARAKQKWDGALDFMRSRGYIDEVSSTKIERLYQ